LVCSRLLEIDTEEVSQGIENYIVRLTESHGAEAVVMGLSGGVDSAVLAALVVRALGPERVLAYYLYDRDNEKKSAGKAQLLADWLDIELEFYDIGPAMHKGSVYKPLIMRMTGLFGFVNRHFGTRMHRILCGELPFLSTLHKGSFGGSRIRRFLYNNTVRHVESGFNARHIYRRKYLEDKAVTGNGLVLGAANKSECMVGWFVKDGVDDMPFSPLNRLYKTQVWQLARYLGLPGRIRRQIPSPDMAKGITDEHAMGISYKDLDVILHGLENAFSDEQIVGAGVTRRQISHVRRMHELSAWKRTS
jgi:NAD+ synthase